MMDPYEVIKYPLMTEVTSRMLEAENKLVFIVDKAAIRKTLDGLWSTFTKLQ